MTPKPNVCPRCASRFQDIRGVVFPDGDANRGYQCDSEWHWLMAHDPNVLVLSDDDRMLLRDLLVKV